MKTKDLTTGRARGLASAIVLAGLTAVGCATSAPLVIPTTRTVPETWQSAAAAAESVTTQKTGDLSRWWQMLEDAELTSLIERALSASPDLRSARARLRQARAQRGLSAIPLLPSVSASVSASSSKTDHADASTLYNAGFDASWEPDVFGGTRRSVSAADADLQATAASLQDTQVSLVAEVARNYVEVRAAQAQIDIARQNLERQQETLDLTRWRAEAGLTSSLDVEQARANLEQTRAGIPSLETTLAGSEHRLAILLGLAPGALRDELTKTGTIPHVPERVTIGIPADTLRQRPDVSAAERTLAAETARLGQAKAARYPSLRLSGSIGVDALTPGGLFDAAKVTRSVLAGLTAPLFNRASISRKIDVQDAVREQALVAYDKAVLSALEDVENAVISLANSRRRQQALTSAAEAARNAALMARQRYTAGLADFQTVLDTERSLLSIEDSLRSSEAAGVSALIQLYKALGGGWPSTPVSGPTDVNG